MRAEGSGTAAYVSETRRPHIGKPPERLWLATRLPVCFYFTIKPHTSHMMCVDYCRRLCLRAGHLSGSALPVFRCHSRLLKPNCPRFDRNVS